MNILITGASGFIGSCCLNFLMKRFNVYGLVRKKPSIEYFNKFNNKLIISDLNDLKLQKKIPNKIDVIIHSGASNDQDTNKIFHKPTN